MTFYILASLLVFIFVIGHAIKRNSKLKDNSDVEFWENEARANNVRRKNIDNLDYIMIQKEKLPFTLNTESFAEKSQNEIADCIRILGDLSEQRILNLSGITNTELKLKYGTANITPLSQYDVNYTVLARTLQRWAEALYAEGAAAEALTVLEFALSTGTDVIASYTLAKNIYTEQNQPEKAAALKDYAEKINGLNKGIILDKLNS